MSEKVAKPLSFGRTFIKTASVLLLFMLANLIGKVLFQPTKVKTLFADMQAGVNGKPVYFEVIGTLLLMWLVISLVFAVIYYFYLKMKGRRNG